jgi:hypothetical protein
MSGSNIAVSQSGDYIPRKDALFRAWALAFAAEVAKDPEAVGLTAAESVQITDMAELFATAYDIAVKPMTRTVGSVLHKKEVRGQVEAALRMYAQKVKHTPGVSWAQLEALGVHVDDPTRTKIGPPVTAPAVTIAGSPQPGVHKLVCTDQYLFAVSKRKPHGVAYLQLYAAVGRGRINDVRFAEHLGDYTRQPIRVTWPHELSGKTATYFARWCNGKGEPGPWSLPMAMSITGVAGADVDEPGLTHEEWLIARAHATSQRQRAAA